MAEKHTFRLRVMGEIPSIYENGEAFTGIALEGSHEAIRSVARHFLDAVVVTPADIHDKLVEALKAARTVIQEDRDEIFDSVTVAGIESTMDEIDRPSVERMDSILTEIDAALASLDQESGQ